MVNSRKELINSMVFVELSSMMRELFKKANIKIICFMDMDKSFGTMDLTLLECLKITRSMDGVNTYSLVVNLKKEITLIINLPEKN